MYAADEEPEEFKKSKKSATPSLRVDHSQVYFENERLSDVLHTNLNRLASHKHKEWMNLGSEIGEIRRTLQDYRTLQKTQTGLKSNKMGGPSQPQTSSAYLCRRTKPKQPTMATELNSPAESSSSDDSDDSSLVDDDPFRNSRKKLATGSAKVVSKHKGSLSSIESSDSKNATMNNKARSTPFVTQLQKRSRTSLSYVRLHNKQTNRRGGSAAITRTTLDTIDLGYSNVVGGSGGANTTDVSDERRFNLMCEMSNSTLSRRQLIEMTNVNSLLDGHKRPTFRQVLLENNRIHMQQLQNRVKIFVGSIEKLKQKNQEAKFLKSLRLSES